MKQLAIILFLLLVFISSCRQLPNKDVAKVESNKDLNKLDNYINNLEKKGLYGSFLFMENNKVLLSKSIGYANKEEGIKSHKDIIYPFGSIVKDYTRTLILLLITESKLDPFDPISKFYPNIPEDKKDITIAQLLQHKSGLNTYHETAELRKKHKGIPADLLPGTKDEALSSIFSQKLKFKPGSDELYSNSGYTLLAYLAENITGKEFDILIREYILEPAKMTTSDFYSSRLWNPENVAVCYGRMKYGKENSPYYWPRNPNQLIGNGGMAGTLKDYYKGLKFMMSLEEKNKKFATLSKKLTPIQEMPEDIIGSSGGGNLGNVALIFGIKSKNQYLIFASNNDDDGMEDVDMLRDVTIMAFDFDIASLAPEEFENNYTDENNLSKLNDGEKNLKWGLPNKPKYLRLGAFLDFISNQMDIRIFEEEHCTKKFSQKIKKLHKTWPNSKSMKLNQVASSGTEMELTLTDTISQKKYVFDIIMDREKNFKFKSIKLKK